MWIACNIMQLASNLVDDAFQLLLGTGEHHSLREIIPELICVEDSHRTRDKESCRHSSVKTNFLSHRSLNLPTVPGAH
jgi:hypothetical protein